MEVVTAYFFCASLNLDFNTATQSMLQTVTENDSDNHQGSPQQLKRCFTCCLHAIEACMTGVLRSNGNGKQVDSHAQISATTRSRQDIKESGGGRGGKGGRGGHIGAVSHLRCIVSRGVALEGMTRQKGLACTMHHWYLHGIALNLDANVIELTDPAVAATFQLKSIAASHAKQQMQDSAEPALP